MNMRPEQFTMWLRGVLDVVGPGEAIPKALAAQIHAQLTEVIGGQVAQRMQDAWTNETYGSQIASPSWGVGAGGATLR